MAGDVASVNGRKRVGNITSVPMLSGLGVAASVALVAVDVKRAEPSDLDALASSQRFFQTVDDGLDDQLGLQQIRLVSLGDEPDEVGA